MADTKRVEQITSRDEDFGKWYTDVVKKAQLVDYSGVKGFVVLRPYAYALWENLQKNLDAAFKRTGHENVYMPMLIPESLLEREKDLVEGFAPEVAWVTHGGSEPLAERLCIRPTSETLFCEHYKNVVHSWRDLPKKYNQWCSVVRWEKTTRPFLRHREFLWQEGHTIHATSDEALRETLDILDLYADFCREFLALPVLKGQKTESEKFPGAVSTYAIESMMYDGRGLQAGTTHYFGDKFSKAFEIEFTDRDNTLKNPFQSSWGVSTRLLGGVIMAHGDDSGLVLPPKIAPVQVVIVPAAMHKPGVLEKARELLQTLENAGIRAQLDDSDNSPGWKFSEHEMRGVPIRLEIGPRDIEKGVCLIKRRDGGEKTETALCDTAETVIKTLDLINAAMYDRAAQNMKSRTRKAETLAEMKDGEIGFVEAKWCGSAECEEKIKEATGMKSRCIPFEQDKREGKCVCCGEKAETTVVFGYQY